MQIPLDQVPHDYEEYVRFLKAAYGVRLFANRTMMLPYKIGEGEIETPVTPVGLERMVQLFGRSDVYVTC